MQPELQDAIQQTERALLGSILLDNSLWPQTETLTADDFSDSHRKIYRCMSAMFEDQQVVDSFTLGEELAKRKELETIGGHDYLASVLMEQAFPKNFAAYVRSVREAGQRRRYDHLFERASDVTDTDQKIQLHQQMIETLKGGSGSDYRSLFHSFEEFTNAPQLEFAIEGFLQEGGATIVAGLPGHSKTLAMLAMTRSLLECKPLFGYFKVTRPSKRVLYLIPESTIGPFWSRIQLFHLEEYVRSGHLLIHTLSAKERLQLNDPRLLAMAGESDIFIDTVARFMTGGEDIEDARELADSLFGLLGAGARTITAAHHSPKAFATAQYMCLENVVRGSGDLGASICTAWGLRQIDAVKNSVYVQNVKPRDFQPCEAFIIQGRPSIDETGYFEMTHPPGFAGDLSDHKGKDKQAGRPAIADRDGKKAQAREMKANGEGYREIAKQLGVSVGTVSGWLSAQGV
jgi:hypothetical protein